MKIFLGRKVYSLLLLAYPKEFRHEYGRQMAQLLRDCERTAPNALARVDLWVRTLADFVRTVPTEHLQNLRKEDNFMSRLRNDLAAIGACVFLIAISAVLLNFGRSHQVSAILLIGYALDAIVMAGIVGNLIVFLLGRLTSHQPLRIAFWTFLMVCGVLLIAALAVAARVDPAFNTSIAANIFIGYVVSFFFWYGLHWVWTQRLKPSATV